MEKKHSTTVIVLVGVLALLFGCVFGGLLGGVVTYAITSRATAQGAATPLIQSTPELRLPVTPEIQISGNLAVVTNVVEGSPAEKAGLQVGDVIVRFDGKRISDGGLADMLSDYAPGDEVTLIVLSNGQRASLDLVLGENAEAPGQAWMGITYHLMSGELDRMLDQQGD